jgi:hypothetical protein
VVTVDEEAVLFLSGATEIEKLSELRVTYCPLSGLKYVNSIGAIV